MAASKEDISRWFDEGVAKGATHMAIICDKFDWEYFPRYVMPGQMPKEVAGKMGDMERLMEVYALHKPKDPQMKQFRCFDYDMPNCGPAGSGTNSATT